MKKKQQEPIIYHVVLTDMDESDNPKRRTLCLEAHSADGRLSHMKTYTPEGIGQLRRDLRLCFETFGVPPYVPPRCLTFELCSSHYGEDTEGRWIQDVQTLLGEEMVRRHRLCIVQAGVCDDHQLHLRMDITTRSGLKSGRSLFNLHFMDVLDDIAVSTYELRQRINRLLRCTSHDGADNPI